MALCWSMATLGIFASCLSFYSWFLLTEFQRGKGCFHLCLQGESLPLHPFDCIQDSPFASAKSSKWIQEPQTLPAAVFRFPTCAGERCKLQFLWGWSNSQKSTDFIKFPKPFWVNTRKWATQMKAVNVFVQNLWALALWQGIENRSHMFSRNLTLILGHFS